MKELKNKKIIIFIIVLIIIVLGFVYGEETSNKYEEVKVDKIEVKKEKKEEIKKAKFEIKGEVKNPGVYEINENDRVIDAINKAGGLTEKANINNINLSKKLVDEMIIIIYSNKEIEEYFDDLEKEKEIIKYQIIEKQIPCPNISNNACIDEKEEINSEDEEVKNSIVNINEATKESLLTLPGIGESKADLIIKYRENNKFESIEDIKNVKGIGESLFEKIKDYITV